jgi:Integrase core domain
VGSERAGTAPVPVRTRDDGISDALDPGTRSFFSSLKKERIKKQIYKNRELAVADVAHYIDSFYNSTRRHSQLGGVSPEHFEAAHKPPRKGLHQILGTPSRLGRLRTASYGEERPQYDDARAETRRLN